MPFSIWAVYLIAFLSQRLQITNTREFESKASLTFSNGEKYILQQGRGSFYATVVNKPKLLKTVQSRVFHYIS